MILNSRSNGAERTVVFPCPGSGPTRSVLGRTPVGEIPPAGGRAGAGRRRRLRAPVFLAKEHRMKPNCKLTTVLLVILGVLDLVAIPFMIAANHHTKGTPPVPAIVVVGVVAVATLISAAGVARGLRWAFWVAMTGRIIDALSNFLGLTSHPTPVTAVVGGVGLVLSIAAIVLLVWVNPRRAARRASAASAPSAPSGESR